MTKRELASFALKLLGIYAIIQFLPFLQVLGSLASLTSSDPAVSMYRWTLLGALASFALIAAVGAALFVYSRELAPRLMGEDAPLNVSSALNAQDVQAIGFSIVGVLILLGALPDFMQFMWNWAYTLTHSAAQLGRGPAAYVTWPRGLSIVIQLVLAIVLFLQARGLTNLWHRLQAGRYTKTE